MGRASRVVFDADDVAHAGLVANKVNKSDTLLVSSSTESDGYATVTIATTFPAQGRRELPKRAALVEMGCEGEFEMAQARCYMAGEGKE